MLPSPPALTFYKYQALGNDMIVIDPAFFAWPLTPALIRHLCDRHFGPGADGICYGPLPGSAAIPAMRFFNPDGSESAKSGNGLRIFARYLWQKGYVRGNAFTLAIGAEQVEAELLEPSGDLIRTTMGRASFHSRDVPVSGPSRQVVGEEMMIAAERYEVTAVSVGNPHCVIFTANASAAMAQMLGPAIETAAHFPQRTNVQFVQVIDEQTIRIEIWERGAGYTLASGSSSCAAAAAAVRNGRCHSPVTVQMAGGKAEVTINDNWRLSLTGGVTAVYEGALAQGFDSGGR
jgi:diaminopimelate epimerase